MGKDYLNIKAQNYIDNYENQKKLYQASMMSIVGAINRSIKIFCNGDNKVKNEKTKKDIIEKYWSPEELERPFENYLEGFGENLNEYEIRTILKRLFYTLQSHGYIESELGIGHSVYGYKRSVFKEYKVREYRLTDKGKKYLKGIAR